MKSQIRIKFLALCAGISFCGNAHAVIDTEPDDRTDPAARATSQTRQSSLAVTDLGSGLSRDANAPGSTDSITIVPETGAALLGALGLLALLLRRR